MTPVISSVKTQTCREGWIERERKRKGKRQRERDGGGDRNVTKPHRSWSDGRQTTPWVSAFHHGLQWMPCQPAPRCLPLSAPLSTSTPRTRSSDQAPPAPHTTVLSEQSVDNYYRWHSSLRRPVSSHCSAIAITAIRLRLISQWNAISLVIVDVHSVRRLYTFNSSFCRYNVTNPTNDFGLIFWSGRRIKPIIFTIVWTYTML